MGWLNGNWKKLVLGIFTGLLIIALFIFWPVREDLGSLKNIASHYNVKILRDTYGVPHVFGHTDKDAAYGLAYAHSEDDFLTIQQVLIAARGDLATVYGKDSAPADYLVHFLRVWDVVDAQYGRLSPGTRALVEGYADGLNVYAAYHPREVLPGLFPVTGKDIVAASVEKSPLFFDLDKTIAHLFSDDPEPALTPTQAIPNNSNEFAIGPSRTSDGQTYLDVNSHQPYTGPVAWYEAHVHSDEGWDMVGGTFPASPLIIHGHNRDLGWAFTVNHPDLIDVYRLTINPQNPNQYLYDGQWRDLEVRQARLKVKLIGNLKITVSRETLWSVYGPAVRAKGNTYALRYAGIGTAGIWEQLYRMNKATNFKEWQDAMRLGQLPMFNVAYADKEGNIYYLYNGIIPVRNEGYDWTGYLPGDTSKTLWTEYLPFDKLPQVLNPPSGFVQNGNGTPYRTTIGAGNPDPDSYSPTLGIDTLISNRSLRMLELFGADESITPEEFVKYKFDMHYSQESILPQIVQLIAAAHMPDADTARAQEVVRSWDLSADPENPSAGLMVLTIMNLNHKYPGSINIDRLGQGNFNQAMVLDSFTQATQTLMQHFGRVDVKWGDVNRLMRGRVDLPIGGGPDILHATYGELQEDGRLKTAVGDSYVLLAIWDREGTVHSMSVHQFGSSTLHEESPHYADQAPLLAARKLKPVWFEEADIRAHLEEEYIPGQEK
ncbi:MAG: penicillin acylase family protein [Bacteroidota bacterium]